MIALIEAHRAGLFKRRHWWPNAVSGIVVGVIALPLAMAFAIASGARPEQGLYTTVVAGLLVAIFGGSRFQVAGPTGAFVAILAGITAQFGIAGLQVATMMAGAMLVLIGLLGAGGLMRHVPAVVIAGFTAGIGVIVFVGQWGSFFGLKTARTEHFHQKISALLGQLPQAHLATMGIGLFSLAVLLIAPKYYLPKTFAKWPRPLLAIVLATLLLSALEGAGMTTGVATIASAFGGIPQGLPAFALPDIAAQPLKQLLMPALSIALLGAIESVLCCAVADGMAKLPPAEHHNAKQELIGQGIANLITPLFGGFAATGGLARTAANVRNGATGPLSAIVHVLTVLWVLLVLAPLAANIPLTCLAAILFVVAWNLSDVNHCLQLLKHAHWTDKTLLLVTFLLTVFIDLTVAVLVGVALAMAFKRFVRPHRQQT
jgi:sulfate permease, SulP family